MAKEAAKQDAPKPGQAVGDASVEARSSDGAETKAAAGPAENKSGAQDARTKRALAAQSGEGRKVQAGGDEGSRAVEAAAKGEATGTRKDAAVLRSTAGYAQGAMPGHRFYTVGAEKAYGEGTKEEHRRSGYSLPDHFYEPATGNAALEEHKLPGKDHGGSSNSAT